MFQSKIYKKIFTNLWRKARESLSKCESLTIIGYSFPSTDFYTKKLFLESFSKNNKLKELILVNPDKNICQKVKELCHFDQVVYFENLEKFVLEKNNGKK